MKIEILLSPGCANGAKAQVLVADVLRELAPEVGVETTTVVTPADAERLRFPGSPTVRVNGRDIDPQAPADVGLG